MDRPDQAEFNNAVRYCTVWYSNQDCYVEQVAARSAARKDRRKVVRRKAKKSNSKDKRQDRRQSRAEAF